MISHSNRMNFKVGSLQIAIYVVFTLETSFRMKHMNQIQDLISFDISEMRGVKAVDML